MCQEKMQKETDSPPKEKAVIEKYIEAIYIYDKAGVCLTNIGLKPENLDEQVVSGFFTAIKKIGQQLIPGTRIKCLIMSGHKLFYDDFENITFCVQCHEDLPNRVIEYILNEISNDFLEAYKDFLPLRDGNVTRFEGFNTYLEKFMEKDIIEGLLEDFGYKMFSEGVILFDGKQDKILFFKVPKEYSSRKQISMGGMLINMAKKFSNEFKGGEVHTILISTENRWICVSKREHIYIIVLFPKVESIELNLIIEKTEEILNNILHMLQIKMQGE